MSLPLRVLHVHAGNMFGGVEAMLLTHVRQRHLCPSLETSFALCFDGRFAEELTAAGATVHRLGNVRARNVLSVKRARRNLQELLKQEPFDTVVTHSCWSQAIFGPPVRAESVSLAFYMHSPSDGKHWLERWARRTQPDLVLCNSNFTAATSATLFPQVHTETVYCPVALPAAVASDLDRESARLMTRAELQTPPDATVIIQVSRMEPWKGQAVHLEALSLLKDVPGWVCWQVGGAQNAKETAYLDRLKQRAADLGIAERVRFLGQRADVMRLLSAADVFCQPNTAAEPFGVVFVEALSAGLPVVTTDLGGAREIVDAACGVLVPASPKSKVQSPKSLQRVVPLTGEAPALAAVLRGLIQDPALRERLGAAGPARAQQLCDARSRLADFQKALSGLMPTSSLRVNG